ncbi:hypothetical protein ABTM31_20785, partial [Acinetobacter baumannii]
MAVPDPSRAVGTVPLDRLVAFKDVSDAPLPECVPVIVPVELIEPTTSSATVGDAEPIPTLPAPVMV